jgi:hypothetical protein
MNKSDISKELHLLTEQYRNTCLWFLRDDFFPKTNKEALLVVNAVKRYGDGDGYKRARKIEAWL